MITSAAIPVIEGDMDALAEHARSLVAAGAAFADTGARVHATWQGLAVVYVAPEAGQLLAATGPVAQVAASVGEDVGTVGRVLGVYAEEVRQIQVRLDAMRAEVDAFESADPGESDRLLTAVGLALADFDDAQRRCARAITALGGGAVARAAAPPAPAPAPAPAVPVQEEVSPLEVVGEAGAAVVNGGASLGNAILHNPLEALAVAGGAALTVVSAAGVTAGGVVSLSGVGAVAGVPLAAVSAAGVVTGVGIAGAAGASLLSDALGQDAITVVENPFADTAPTMIDANGTAWDRNGTWEPIPGATPDGERIAHDAGSRTHIPYGEERPDGSVGGGHWHGSGRPGKTVFPEAWGPERILEETLDVARNPDRTPEQRPDGSWLTEGTRDGVDIRVVLQPDGTIITGHPTGGVGVELNDENGDPQPIN